MLEITELDRIINRHMARLLTGLEDANCPAIFIQAVRNEIAWMRSDLKELPDVKALAYGN